MTLAPWAGWALTGGVWAYRAWPRTPPPPPPPPRPDPVTDGWRCELRNADGVVESIRRINDGSAPTRIERGHGHHTSAWYRLVAVDDLALIYQPEPAPPQVE